MTEVERKKILIVDDDQTFLMILQRQVTKAGFDVETASNGTEAIDKVRAAVPHLVILDAMMPQMNGFEACRRIRAMDVGKELPIIMLTALKADSDAANAKEAGATDFLRKPVKGEDLIRSILSHLHPSAPRV